MDKIHLTPSRELLSLHPWGLELDLSSAEPVWTPAGAGNHLKPFWLCISVNDWGSQVGFLCYLCLAELYFPVKGTRAEFLSHSGSSAPALCLLGDGVRCGKLQKEGVKQQEGWIEHQEGQRGPRACTGLSDRGNVWLCADQMCLGQSRCADQICISGTASLLLPALIRVLSVNQSRDFWPGEEILPGISGSQLPMGG